MFCIYDLDGTVICSAHRKATLSDGSLDLDHWIENNTPEKIANDSLLPLVSLLRKNWRMNHTIVICTARVLQTADFSFMAANNIPFQYILSRPEGCTMADHQLKDILLRLFAQEHAISWRKFCQQTVVYDDNNAVLNHLGEIGLLTKNAVTLNKVMANAA